MGTIPLIWQKHYADEIKTIIAVVIEHPLMEKAAIIYDGECRFCRDQIARIKAWDSSDSFDYVAAQSPDLSQEFPILKDMNLESGMRFVSADRKSVAVGADAVYQIARRLPRTSWLAWLYVIPGCNQIGKLMYGWIAANRKRLGQTCDDGVCQLPHSTDTSAQSTNDHK